MKMLLLGVVGVLALQALLVVGYLAVSRYDPIVLNPDRGRLDDSGVTMVMFCGRAAHPNVGVVECWRRCPPTETWARGRGEGRCGAIATSGTTSKYRTAEEAETKKLVFLIHPTS
jgi:hypothetical protein